jgi:hypothetical protein
MTQTVAGGIEIGKEPLDILFGRVATGGGFNGGKDGGQMRRCSSARCWILVMVELSA